MFAAGTFRPFGPRARRASAAFASLAFLACVGAIQAQQPSSPPPPAPRPQEVTTLPASSPVTAPAQCIQPAPMVRWQDYQGPFAKVVGVFGRELERKSVHPLHGRSMQPLHYMPGPLLCTFSVKDKFILFVRSSMAPVTFFDAGFDAAISQAEDNDPTFGQGAAGYADRYGAALADQASYRFFKSFAYPSLFSEDPRYYRMGRGTTGERLLHALGHSVIAYRVDGTRMFNCSEWFGTTSAIVLSNTYHPGNRRGFDPAAEAVGESVASDAGFDALREFWPEIARKFKLPFRGSNEPAD
ncbi:MAG: hypothetical protein ACLQMT_08455 [Candidatus Acidiferrales bacterium]